MQAAFFLSRTRFVEYVNKAASDWEEKEREGILPLQETTRVQEML